MICQRYYQMLITTFKIFTLLQYTKYHSRTFLEISIAEKSFILLAAKEFSHNLACLQLFCLLYIKHYLHLNSKFWKLFDNNFVTDVIIGTVLTFCSFNFFNSKVRFYSFYFFFFFVFLFFLSYERIECRDELSLHWISLYL